jgi:hypothetical protein
MKSLENTYRLLVIGILGFMFACSNDGGHYQDKVLDKKFTGDTYEYLKSKPGLFDSLVTVIDRLGLEKTLRDSNITLFALDNQSFRLALNNLNNIRKLTEKKPVSLANVKYKHLDTLMTQYIIRGRYMSDSLLNQDGLKVFGIKYGYPMQTSLNKLSSSGVSDGGPRVIDLFDTRRSPFRRNWVGASTSSINIETSNALVHVLSTDHIFGFNDFVYRMTFIPPPLNLFKSVGGKGTVQPGKEGSNTFELYGNVYDGNKETKYLIIPPNGSVWFQFEFNEPTIANSYTITSANGHKDRNPRDWVLDGSNDGVNWFNLDTRSGELFEQTFLTRVFRMKNTKAYKFYRIDILRSGRSDQLEFADWTMNREEPE